MTLRPDQSTCSIQFLFPDFTNETHLELSLDGGATFPYSTADHVESHDILGLPEGTYSIHVRHPGSVAQPMGQTTISNTCMLTSQVQYNLTESIEVFPNPTSNIFHITGLAEIITSEY